ALASVDAVDPLAAAAYADLGDNTNHPEFAWLYCRAAERNGVATDPDLYLFAQTFATRDAARAFYAQRNWDFDEVEYTYLVRSAARQPGAFPPTLGADYPANGEKLLLERSQGLERGGDLAAATACSEVLLKLAPRSPAAHDRLAYLAYQGGVLERACRVLQDWNRLLAGDPLSVLQPAGIALQRGHPVERSAHGHQAMGII